MYTIKIKGGRKTRDALQSYLNKKGIMAKVYYHPVHLAHFYKRVLKHRPSLPVTENISGQVLTLPMYPTLSKDEIDFMAKEIRKFFSKGYL